MAPREVSKKCQEDIAYQDCYSLCLKAYKDLDSLFDIVPDNYGGYKLTYVGKEDVPPDTVFKTCPVGFLAPVLDNITDLSVIKKTSQNKNDVYVILNFAPLSKAKYVLKLVTNEIPIPR